MIKSKKAVNEIISTILIMLVMVIVVGIIITGVNSQISKGKEKTNYDNSIKVRDMVFSEIMEIYNSPIESTKEINFSLSNLELTIDSDTETIEICSVGKNLSFFADGKRLEQDNNKYVYRELQKICSGVAFENIDLVRSITLSNKEQTRLVFKKITENKISVSVDNETSTSWYTQKNEYVYDENAGEWLYRKKILITGNNIFGDLNNIPITITLTDEDIKSYANEDASDLLFTLTDGVTKLKKEIVNYDSGTGELTALLSIPSFNVGPDVNIYTYDEKTRKKITIDHTKVNGDLNDFPILISIKDENLVNLANSDGNDIYFTASDGTTKLKREIESFTDINLFRKKITIDHTKVDATLTNFPVLISITDSDLANYGTNADGNDIYFTLNSGYPKLKREIEDYNYETGELVAWVKVPSLSSTTDTNIYLYFGNSEESNTNDTDVWDSNYVGVWHSKDYNSTTITDSTSNNNNGTKIESNGPIQTIGKIGYAQDFDGSNDYISISSATIETTSFWANFNSVTAAQYFLGGYYMGVRYNGTDFLAFNGSSGYITLNWAKENAWKYFTITRANANDYNIYIDGNYLGVTTAGTSGADIAITLIGKRSDGYLFNGPIDELRISNSVRSESWIKTEYNNQNAPERFYTIGDLEDVAINLVAWVKIPNLSSTTDTDIYMYFGDENESNTNDTDVWDENFVGVWHNTDFNASYVKESKTGLASASKIGSNQPTQTIGKVGYAQYFDGVNDAITTNINNVSYTKSTISFWANFKKVTGSPGDQILGSAYWTNDNFALNHHSSDYRMLLSVGNSKYAAYYNAFSQVENWYYYSFTYDSDQTAWADALKLYIDGVAKSVSASSGDTDPLAASGANYLKMGKGGYFNGLIDEVRISNTLRSESWTKTEYNNQSSPSTFYSVGEMVDANVVILTTPTTANANTGVYLYFGNSDANISDYDIGDGNVVNISIGVLEKS